MRRIAGSRLRITNGMATSVCAIGTRMIERRKLIDAVDKAAHAYPWKTTYRAFPGPNSNTFTAWIAKQVPKLQLDLPFSAIGSGYVDKE